MKTEKEYPATHSMLTSWFAIDENGDIAIMNYEDNGPVPVGTPDMDPEEIVMDYMTYEVAGKPYRILPLNKQEVKRLLDICEPYPDSMLDYEGYSYAIVRIEESCMEEFIKAVMTLGKRVCEYTVCLDEDERIFYLSWFAYEHEDIIAIDKIKSSCFIKPIGKIDFSVLNDELPLYGLPFYIYNQPYSCGKPLARVSVPSYPFTADRLPEKARKIAHRLDLNFSKSPMIQIAEQLPSHNYACEERIINNRPYAEIYDCEDKEVLVAEESIYTAGCGKNCRICYKYGDRHNYNCRVQKTRTPTVLVITDLTSLSFEYRDSFDLPYSKAVFIPIVEGLPHPGEYISDKERQLDNFPIMTMFSHCRINLEKNIGFFRPRVILIYRDVLKYLKAFYKIEENMLHISRATYPVFIWEEREESISMINRLADMPYCGGEIQWKIDGQDN